MKKLITKDDVKQIKFYQMPKVFFHSPKYMAMRCESKLAYMLMLDLLPLSVKNNWANNKGEVFVKVSQAKLKSLLHIKGSQKAAQVMKELVSYGLIINQRVGLTKCNEIYLYYPEDAQIETSPVQEPAKEPAEKDELTRAIAEVEDLLENQIHMEDLRQKYDPKLVNEVGHNIKEMFLNTTTPIGNQNKPMVIMQGVIRQLEMHHIEHVIDQFKIVCTKTEILNPKRYMQTMIYNSIYEANAKTIGHIGYHFGYC